MNMKFVLLTLSLIMLAACETPTGEVRNIDPVMCGDSLKSACAPEVPDLKLEVQLRQLVPAKIKLKIDGKTLFDQCIADSYDTRRTKITKDNVRSIFRVYHYDFTQSVRDIKIEIIDRGDGCNQVIPLLTQDGIYLSRRTVGSDQVVEGYIYQ
jgi:hypothetical protein